MPPCQSRRANPKDALLRRNESASGIYGGLSTDISRIITASADYQYLTGDSTGTKQQVHASIRISREFLKNIPRLTLAQAYYQKNNIGARTQDDDPESEIDLFESTENDFFESTEDTFYGYLLGLEMAGGVSVLAR